MKWVSTWRQRAVTLWQSVSQRARSLRQDAPVEPLPVRFKRDPDLDSAHERQHDLLNVATTLSGHEQIAERLRMRQRWQLEAEFWQQRPMESNGGSH